MTMRDSIAAARISPPSPQEVGVIAFEFRFGAGDPTFAGHFPSRPLLPGVFQIEMARVAAEWCLGYSLTIREVCKAKFLRPILPEEFVRLELSLSENSDAIQARAELSVNGERAGGTVLRLCRNAE